MADESTGAPPELPSRGTAADNVNIQLIYSAFRLPGVVLTNHDPFRGPGKQRRIFLNPPRFSAKPSRPPSSNALLPESSTEDLPPARSGDSTHAPLHVNFKNGGLGARRSMSSSGDDDRELQTTALHNDADSDSDSEIRTWSELTKYQERITGNNRSDNTDTYNKVRHLIFSQAKRQNIAKLEQKTHSFNQIVDIDDEAFENHVSDDLAARFGEGVVFRTLMMIVIVANSLHIGLQTDTDLAETHHTFFTALDDVFLAIFIMEILLKWYYAFQAFWKSAWNIFDFALVITALFSSNLGSGRILRILRVLRSFRSLRSVAALNGLRTVVETVTNSLPDMTNIILLLLIVMFIFSVLGVTLFAADVPDHFGDLGSAMWTLFILLTLDGWIDVFSEIRDNFPGLFSVAALYFGAYITIAGFIFANMIVAVVVINLEINYAALRQKAKWKFRQLKSDVNQDVAGSKQRPLAHAASESSAWRRQVPYEVPEFEKISAAKVRDYILLLTIIEENLKEYVATKNQIQEILTELKVINAAPQGQGEEDFLSSIDDDLDLAEEDEEEIFTGDVLSQLIRNKRK